MLGVLILGPIILVSCWRTLGNDSKRAVIMPHDENFEDVCDLQYDLMVSIMMHEDVCFGPFLGSPAFYTYSFSLLHLSPIWWSPWPDVFCYSCSVLLPVLCI